MRGSNRRPRSLPDMESPAIAADPAAHVDAPADPSLREADSSLICAVVAEACADALAPQLRTLILTGSLAREEGTFRPAESGTVLLGDAEFLLLFHDQFPLPPAARVAALESVVEARLQREGLRAEVELSPCHSRYLRSLEPHMLAYELRVCGRTVGGDPDVLSLVPSFSCGSIPREDAWRLLCNRLIEQLEPLAWIRWLFASPTRAVLYSCADPY